MHTSLAGLHDTRSWMKPDDAEFQETTSSFENVSRLKFGFPLSRGRLEMHVHSLLRVIIRVI